MLLRNGGTKTVGKPEKDHYLNKNQRDCVKTCGIILVANMQLTAKCGGTCGIIANLQLIDKRSSCGIIANLQLTAKCSNCGIIANL
jgi:hypothetical protein